MVMKPGEYLLAKEEILANEGRVTGSIQVSNRGDRPIQVGSHYHFFEVNRSLDFDREASLGMRLNIPSGTAVRFEPGQTHRVELVALGGKGLVHGFNRLVEGSIRGEAGKKRALVNAEAFLEI
jgi:urease subunit beta